jgi:hypothetical protein
VTEAGPSNPVVVRVQVAGAANSNRFLRLRVSRP